MTTPPTPDRYDGSPDGGLDTGDLPQAATAATRQSPSQQAVSALAGECQTIAAHTPGPWKVVRYGDGDSLVVCMDEAGDWRICFMATPGESPKAWQTIKANARLIAAAPTMLATLWSALSAANELALSGADFPRDEIEAAIALASTGAA